LESPRERVTRPVSLFCTSGGNHGIAAEVGRFVTADAVAKAAAWKTAGAAYSLSINLSLNHLLAIGFCRGFARRLWQGLRSKGVTLEPDH